MQDLEGCPFGVLLFPSEFQEFQGHHTKFASTTCRRQAARSGCGCLLRAFSFLSATVGSLEVGGVPRSARDDMLYAATCSNPVFSRRFLGAECESLKRRESGFSQRRPDRKGQPRHGPVFLAFFAS